VRYRRRFDRRGSDLRTQSTPAPPRKHPPRRLAACVNVCGALPAPPRPLGARMSVPSYATVPSKGRQTSSATKLSSIAVALLCVRALHPRIPPTSSNLYGALLHPTPLPASHPVARTTREPPPKQQHTSPAADSVGYCLLSPTLHRSSQRTLSDRPTIRIPPGARFEATRGLCCSRSMSNRRQVEAAAACCNTTHPCLALCAHHSNTPLPAAHTNSRLT